MQLDPKRQEDLQRWGFAINRIGKRLTDAKDEPYQPGLLPKILRQMADLIEADERDAAKRKAVAA